MAKAAATESATVLEGASPAEGVEFCRAKEWQMVDLQFTGLPGTMQHFSILAEQRGPQGCAYELRSDWNARRENHRAPTSPGKGNQCAAGRFRDDGKNPGFRFTV